MSESITLHADIFTDVAGFIASNGTKGKILSDVSPGRVLPDVSNVRPLPGEAQQRQVLLMGGKGIIEALASNSSAIAQTLKVFVGREASVQADMGTVSTLATSGQIVVNRTNGSHLNDKLSVGASVMLFGNTTAANDGLIGQVTAVTATALTINMPGVTANGSEVQTSGFRVIELGQADTVSIPANAGHSATVRPVNLFNYAGNMRNDDIVRLGAKNLIIGSMAAAVSALPDNVVVSISGGLH
jgi:hypothetical protein